METARPAHDAAESLMERHRGWIEWLRDRDPWSTSMPLRLGLMVYPLFFLVLLVGRRAGSVAKFLDAGATSPERARRPESVGVKRRSDITHLVEKGILKPQSNGRFYVDCQSLRRARQRAYSCAAAGMGCLLLAIVALHHWHFL